MNISARFSCQPLDEYIPARNAHLSQTIDEHPSIVWVLVGARVCARTFAMCLRLNTNVNHPDGLSEDTISQLYIIRVVRLRLE